jgi:hypothetical protein
MKVRVTISGNSIIIGLVPLLRALMDATDKVIFEKLIQGNFNDNFLVNSVTAMLKSAKKEHILTRANATEFIGTFFRYARGFYYVFVFFFLFCFGFGFGIGI